MIISNRERYIGIGVGAVLGLLILDYMAVEPYITHRKAQQAAIADAQKTLLQMDGNEKIHAALMSQWARMRSGGMETTPAKAFDQLDRAMHDWALQSGLVPGDAANAVRPRENK